MMTALEPVGSLFSFVFKDRLRDSGAGAARTREINGRMDCHFIPSKIWEREMFCRKSTSWNYIPKSLGKNRKPGYMQSGGLVALSRMTHDDKQYMSQ